MNPDTMRDRVFRRHGVVRFPRPAQKPNGHHGPSLVRDMAAYWRCSETAAKKRLESWRRMNLDIANVIRTNVVHRDYVSRATIDLVAACVEPRDIDVPSLVQGHAEELADTIPALTAYAADPTDEKKALHLCRELGEDTASSAELRASVRNGMAVVK